MFDPRATIARRTWTHLSTAYTAGIIPALPSTVVAQRTGEASGGAGLLRPSARLPSGLVPTSPKDTGGYHVARIMAGRKGRAPVSGAGEAGRASGVSEELREFCAGLYPILLDGDLE